MVQAEHDIIADPAVSGVSPIWKDLFANAEIVKGMREQGKGIKIYGESDYAPLKAAIVGNPEGIYVPDVDKPHGDQMFKHHPPEYVEYMRKHRNKNLKDVDPKMYDIMAKESNALADAYRQAGVHVIRHESDQPVEITEYASGWSGVKQISIYGGTVGEVLGNIFMRAWEVSYASAYDALHREAIVEAFKNSPDAVWLEMPSLYPNNTLLDAGACYPGPYLSIGDFRIFPKHLVLGLGVADPSHINDPTKQRSSGDEFGAEVMRRMLKLHGWEVSTVYFDSRLSYHVDCVMVPLEEGLLTMPKNALWTELPKPYCDWEVIDMDLEDLKIGCGNSLSIGHKRLVMPQGSKKLAKDLEKRGWTCIEVPYNNLYEIFGSGIQCSTCSIWRES